MPRYYTHMESNENGKDAAAQDFAESRLSEIRNEIEELQKEARMWEHVISRLKDHVCQRCRGQRTVTYYPSGTGPGQGARSSIPCPECRKDESEEAARRLDQQYRGY
jgi:hypothetical protein